MYAAGFGRSKLRVVHCTWLENFIEEDKREMDQLLATIMVRGDGLEFSNRAGATRVI